MKRLLIQASRNRDQAHRLCTDCRSFLRQSLSGKSWDSILLPVILQSYVNILVKKCPDVACVPVGSLKRLCYIEWNLTSIHFIDYKCMYRQYQVSMAAKAKVFYFLLLQINQPFFFFLTNENLHTTLNKILIFFSRGPK